MLEFISNNVGTIIVLAVLFLIVGAILVGMLRDRKKGKHISCGGNCGNCGACAYSGKCPSKNSK